ncbi:hypothetical protein [Aliiroseovarius sp. 2305UL8-7]|uniref:hypothetical protein n=1 Tax=Aliiroseovarius conchicola TaxID=3121637 RepID=UPI0035275E38
MVMKKFEDRIFQRVAPKVIRYLNKPNLAPTNPTLRAVYHQASQEFQLAPPLTIHSADPELLAGLWHATREVFIVAPKGRAVREAVAAAVSEANSCPYCVTVHSGMFSAAGGGQLSRNNAELPANVRDALDWVRASLKLQNKTPIRTAIARADRPQIFGTAALYHYLNKMVSVFLDESPVPIPGSATRSGQWLAQAAMKIIGRRIATHIAAPGQAVVICDAKLPNAFAWSKPNPTVARAFAHFAQAARYAGQEAVPEPVHKIVRDHLASWRGEAAPLSRVWVEDAMSGLAEVHRPAARLALLTARAPWQVSDAQISAFRQFTNGDRALVQTTAWAAFAATECLAARYPS